MTGKRHTPSLYPTKPVSIESAMNHDSSRFQKMGDFPERIGGFSRIFPVSQVALDANIQLINLKESKGRKAPLLEHECMKTIIHEVKKSYLKDARSELGPSQSLSQGSSLSSSQLKVTSNNAASFISSGYLSAADKIRAKLQKINLHK